MAENTTTSNNWLTNLGKGELPTVPVAMSIDSSTLLSLSGVAIIIVAIILFFKHKR